MRGCEVRKDAIELLDVVWPEIGRQSDTGEQDFDVCRLKRGQHLTEIAARVGERQTAKTIVTAEFDDDDRRMQGNNGRHGGECILGGCATGAFVDHAVGVTDAPKFALERSRIGLVGLQAITGGDAIAEADQEGAVRSAQGDADQKQHACDRESAANVHLCSVAGLCGSSNLAEEAR